MRTLDKSPNLQDCLSVTDTIPRLCREIEYLAFKDQPVQNRRGNHGIAKNSPKASKPLFDVTARDFVS